ncbi:MAG: hypothetical protein WDO16_10175 [Bacteroidota bacterium]
MPEEITKEKFGLLTGIFLAWGIIGLKLYEYVSNLNFGSSIGILTANWPSEGTKISLWYFWILSLLIALSFCITFLCIAYVLNTSLQLLAAEKGLAVEKSAKRGAVLYDSVLICTILALFYSFFMLIVSVIPSLIEYAFLSVFSNSKIIGWISRFLVVVLLVLIAIKKWRSLWQIIKTAAATFTYNAFFVSTLCICIGWLCFIAQTFKVEISANNNIYQKAKQDIVEIKIKLGGSASNVKDASVFLVSQKNDTTYLKDFVKIKESDYITFINSSVLDSGNYTLHLHYKHAHLNKEPPFIKNTIKESAAFIVTN